MLPVVQACLLHSENCPETWGDSLIGNVLALQTGGPKFIPRAHIKRGVVWIPKGGDRRIPRAFCQPCLGEPRTVTDPSQRRKRKKMVDGAWARNTKGYILESLHIHIYIQERTHACAYTHTCVWKYISRFLRWVFKIAFKMLVCLVMWRFVLSLLRIWNVFFIDSDTKGL